VVSLNRVRRLMKKHGIAARHKRKCRATTGSGSTSWPSGQRRPSRGLVHHGDRGSGYCSHDCAWTPGAAPRAPRRARMSSPTSKLFTIRDAGIPRLGTGLDALGWSGVARSCWAQVWQRCRARRRRSFRGFLAAPG